MKNQAPLSLATLLLGSAAVVPVIVPAGWAPLGVQLGAVLPPEHAAEHKCAAFVPSFWLCDTLPGGIPQIGATRQNGILLPLNSGVIAGVGASWAWDRDSYCTGTFDGFDQVLGLLRPKYGEPHVHRPYAPARYETGRALCASRLRSGEAGVSATWLIDGGGKIDLRVRYEEGYTGRLTLVYLGSLERAWADESAARNGAGL